jgi:RNA polymerase sigma-70 factor (ECF subfamily)
LNNELPDWLCAGGARFATTDWSDVLAAGDGQSPRAAAAFEQLYRTYWYPLYAYLRREGFAPADAQDAVQGLFTRLLAGNQLAGLAQGRGRFRSFLLVALKHFLINERERALAQKRGGGQLQIPLDLILAEERYDLEPAHHLNAEMIFERRWALTLLEDVLTQLRSELSAGGRAVHFDLLKSFLTGEGSPGTYAEIGPKLGLSEGGVKSAVSRLRARYRALVEEAVARTVASPTDVQDEIRHLFRTLGSTG